jgi:hypothetical protein
MIAFRHPQQSDTESGMRERCAYDLFLFQRSHAMEVWTGTKRQITEKTLNSNLCLACHVAVAFGLKRTNIPGARKAMAIGHPILGRARLADMRRLQQH